MMVPVPTFAEDVHVWMRMNDDVRMLRPAMDMVIDVDVDMLVRAKQGVEYDKDGADSHRQQGDAELRGETFAQEGERSERNRKRYISPTPSPAPM